MAKLEHVTPRDLHEHRDDHVAEKQHHQPGNQFSQRGDDELVPASGLSTCCSLKDRFQQTWSSSLVHEFVIDRLDASRNGAGSG